MGAFSSKGTNKPVPAPKVAPPVVNDIDRTILDLKNSRDRLLRYKKKLEIDDNKLLQRAKDAKLAKQDKTAIQILRLRKYKQIQYNTCEEQLLNILKLVETIDSKRNDAVILDAMKAGKNTLKLMHEETTVDDVLNLFDEINEQHDIENEISNIISNSVPTLSNDIELELEQELNDMMMSMKPQVVVDDETKLLPVVPDTPLLPQVPNTLLPEPEVISATTNAEERIAVPG